MLGNYNSLYTIHFLKCTLYTNNNEFIWWKMAILALDKKFPLDLVIFITSNSLLSMFASIYWFSPKNIWTVAHKYMLFNITFEVNLIISFMYHKQGKIVQILSVHLYQFGTSTVRHTGYSPPKSTQYAHTSEVSFLLVPSHSSSLPQK